MATKKTRGRGKRSADQMRSDAEALAMAGRHAEAARAFRRYLKLRPRDAKVWVNLATMYQFTGSHDAQLEAAETAMRLDESLLGARYVAGSALIYLGRMTEALDLLSAVPPEGGLPALRGIAEAALGLHKEAIASFQLAIFISDGRDSASRLRLADSLLALGRDRDAAQVLRELGSGDQPMPPLPSGEDPRGEACAQLGWVILMKGWRDYSRAGLNEAVGAFKRAILLRSEDFRSRAGLSIAQRILGRNELALDAIEDAISIEGNDGFLQYQRALALTELDRFDEAFEAFSLAAALPNAPGMDELLEYRALAAARSGDYVQAESLVSDARALGHDSVQLRHVLAIAARARGDLEAAEAAFVGCLELDPRDAVTWSNRAWNLADLGRTDAARSAIEEARVNWGARPSDEGARVLASVAGFHHRFSTSDDAAEVLQQIRNDLSGDL